MGAALHFDLWVPNFGVQEYMGYPPEALEVFPHAWEFSQGSMHPGDAPGLGVDIDRDARRQVSVRPGLSAGGAPGRRHVVELVKQNEVSRHEYDHQQRPPLGRGEPPEGMLRRAAVASTIGTAAEYYDFFVYATAAVLFFGKLFFPSSDPDGWHRGGVRDLRGGLPLPGPARPSAASGSATSATSWAARRRWWRPS